VLLAFVNFSGIIFFNYLDCSKI